MTAEETPEQTSEGGGEIEHGGGDGDDKPESTYTPNFKFKSYDKEEEIPERFRALIKDAQSEEEVRKVFEKAYGFDGLKALSTKEKEELSGRAKGYEQQLHQTVENIKKIHAYSQSDLDTFFQVYKIPQEKLFQYVAAKLKESELPPEDLQRLERGRQATIEADYYKDQAEKERQRNNELFKQQHDFHLSQTLSSPDISQFIAGFDSKMGNGAFLQQVNEYGDYVFRTQNGRYVPPMEAVNAVMHRYKAFYQPTIPTQQGAQGQGQANDAPPPVIPNIGSGRSVSPTKPKIKSLDQLKKHVREMTKEA